MLRFNTSVTSNGALLRIVIGSLLAMGLVGVSAMAATAAPGSTANPERAMFQGTLNSEICLALDADDSGDISADEVDPDELESRGVLYNDLIANVGDNQGIADSCNQILAQDDDTDDGEIGDATPVDDGTGDDSNGEGGDVSELPDTGHGSAEGVGGSSMLIVAAVLLASIGMVSVKLSSGRVDQR